MSTPRNPNLGKDLKGFKSDGTSPAFTVGSGNLLILSTTYYFPFGGEGHSLISLHARWPSTLIITSATIEDCNFPSDVTDWDTALGNWVDEDPSTAFVALKGIGVTAPNGVVVATGDAGGGGAMWHIGNWGANRGRLVVVVGGTGGIFRLAASRK